MKVARIALDVPIDELFDYICDDAGVRVGSLVVVPFGKRRIVGVAVELASSSKLPRERLRAVERSLPIAALPNSTMALAAFCSRYYRTPLGQVLLSLLPTALRRPGFAPAPPRWEFRLTAPGATIDPDTLPARASAARKLLACLKTQPFVDLHTARAVTGSAGRLLQRWQQDGWVERRAVVAEPERLLPDRMVAPELTAQQSQIVAQVSAGFGRYAAWLLHGVTGSGKTEIYLQLAAIAHARNLQTLVLVPEINLTPQLETRFRERFPGVEVVSLHSGLGEAERLARWTRARSGAAALVLGTRLAVFTPLPRLGLIVIDEEHDASYKQQEGLRYHARDVAIFLARESGVPIVLGSATPSLETTVNARSGRFGLLRLSSRPSAQPPRVRLIETAKHGAQTLAEPVIEQLRARLERKEQSLVFINRRGYAPVLLCSECGWMSQCPRCAARLTLHLGDGFLRCHYCGHQEKIATACPDCGNQDLRGIGQGTQRVEQALAAQLPGARILRVDSDTTRRKDSFLAMDRRIRGREVDVLVGTQMLAKGHHYPQLTLVVVLGADFGLFSSDFRAAERLFQQLMQVAGRAGRAESPGEVLVQTQFPAHPLYQALLHHDFDAFAEVILAERMRARFPPFVYQAVLRAEAVKEAAVFSFLRRAGREAASLASGMTVYEPVPAPMARLAGRYRGQLLVQSPKRVTLQRFLAQWHPRLKPGTSNAVRWALDVDPIEL
jgi:primosomal protein N' (replication factor Y) (superfamily II helicase)